jgi:hypothetical protein
MMTEMTSGPRAPRELTPNERTLAIATGIAMLCLSFLSLAVMIAIASPVVRLIEGLSK